MSDEVRPNGHEDEEVASDLDFASRLDDEVENDPDSDGANLTRPWDPNLIRVDPKPFSIKQLLDMIDEGELVLQPEFQRRRVWTQKQKSLLIESLLLRIPLPAFYFSAADDGKLQVIDGLQRLSTIHDFVRGGLEGDRKFKLRNLEYLQDTVGKKGFDDLQGQVWARRILQASVTANVVDPQTPVQVKLNIFGRLNRQGTPLSLQELRHAMSGNRSRQFLLELSRNDNFHSATRDSLRESKRMHDIEVVLRFCAFQLHYENYADFGSLAELLTDTTGELDDNKAVTEVQLVALSDAFELSMRNAVAVFGRDAFRKDASKPINRALFEVWSYALSQIPAEVVLANAELIASMARKMMLDQAFNDSISLNTSDPARVDFRFGAVLGSLQKVGVING